MTSDAPQLQMMSLEAGDFWAVGSSQMVTIPTNLDLPDSYSLTRLGMRPKVPYPVSNLRQ